MRGMTYSSQLGDNMTEPIVDVATQKAVAEKGRMVTYTAIENLNKFASSRQDMTVFDIMEYIKLTNIYGAKLISQGALKGNRHPNVKTVIEDVFYSTLQMRADLEPMNPELADDFVWPDEAQAQPVEAPVEEEPVEEKEEE